MTTPLDHQTLTPWITEAAIERPTKLAAYVAERTGASRTAVKEALNDLVDAQWLVREGAKTAPRYRPGALRSVVRHYDNLKSRNADDLWAQDFEPCFAPAPNVLAMARFIVTELARNAIEHSRGTQLTVSIRQTPTQLHLLVSDNGYGVFDSIADGFNLGKTREAMLELAKGKLSTSGEDHRGRGLFFAARIADTFEIHANGAAFRRYDARGDGFSENRALSNPGTAIFATLALDSTRTVESTRQRWSVDGRGDAFDRTTVPLRLLTVSTHTLATAQQAESALSRLSQFRRAELDFDHVDAVEPAFVNTLFGSEAAAGVELVPLGMTPKVAAVINAVRS